MLLLLLLPDSVYAALDSGVTAVRSGCSRLELAVGGPCIMLSGTCCFQSLANIRRAATADEPSASPLLCSAGAVPAAEEELNVPAALLLDEASVLMDSGPPPAPAAAAALGLLRVMNSGTMLMTTLSGSAALDGPACCASMSPAVLLLDAAWLAVVLLLGWLPVPELWRPPCLGCRPLRGELTTDTLRCSAAC
jgi:hypothetical protein